MATIHKLTIKIVFTIHIKTRGKSTMQKTHKAQIITQGITSTLRPLKNSVKKFNSSNNINRIIQKWEVAACVMKH